MFRKLLIATGQFAFSASLFSGLLYSYLYIKSRCNLVEYLACIDAETLKDASRLTNYSFGISWGFQADDTVMYQIDSSDLLFIKYDCSETLSTNHMFTCYKNSLFLLYSYPYTVAYAYRDSYGLSVLINYFGTTSLKRYSYFVSMPYIRYLTMQKSTYNKKYAHLKLQTVANEKPINYSQLYFVNRINSILGNNQYIDNIGQLMITDALIVIRTHTNRLLRSL